MSPNARDRARAKRRYVKRQANLAARAKTQRTRQQVMAVVGSLIVVAAAIGLIYHYTGSGSSPKTPSAAAASSTATSTATPTDSATDTPSSSPTTSATKAADTCPTVTADKVGAPQSFGSAPPKSDAQGKDWTATLHTSCGDITLTLDGKKAPQTVSSFLFLARKGFFNKTTCHRLVTTGIYVLQCGDPTGTGTGGPGYGFGIENAPASGDYPAGTLAMARSTDPNSNGSQFFIVYKDTQLPTTGGGYSIFGSVQSGLGVVKKVAAAGAAAADATGNTPPNTPINITSVTVK